MRNQFLSLEEKVHEEVDYIVNFLDVSKPLKREGSRTHNLSKRFFKNIEPFGMGKLFTPDDDWAIFGDVTLRDVENELDRSWLASNNERDVRYSVTRVRRVTPKEVRGYIEKATKDMVEVAGAVFYEDGKYFPARTWYGFFGGKWTPLNRERTFIDDAGWNTFAVEEKNEDGLTETQMAIVAALGFQFNDRYEWKVALENSNGVSISFTTDPIGAKEMFASRDRHPSRNRRDALRNWVMGHYRKKRKADDMVWVRNHLRGATEFSWHDYKCTILPAPYDIEKNEVK